jgi:oxygen-independent coproporphyrinogen-3 oxidase
MNINGIYIHIPFCSIKCPYCDFTSIVLEDKDIYKKYIKALKKELTMYKDLKFNLNTIYFGGGTPSILPPELIGEIIIFIKENLKCDKNLEITIEANPNTYRYYQLKKIREYGVNRLSIGNQTFNQKHLLSLGRNHKVEDSLNMIEDAVKAGFTNINLDLIYGIENQTLTELEEDLEIYTSLPITHISAYMLTAYEDTPLGSMVLDKKYNLPDEETTTQMFRLIDDYLKNKGFYRYELSNWAKEGYQCKHNLLYWTDRYFLGIGISAWSYINDIRYGNTKNLSEYFQLIEEGVKPVKYVEHLSEEDKRFERIMLGLRLTEGIEISLIRNKDFLEELLKENLAIRTGDKISLTENGLMLINQIVTKLL